MPAAGGTSPASMGPQTRMHAPARGEPTLEDGTQDVVDIWRELFDDPAIDADSDFIALGGTSLLAVRFQGELRSRLGRDLDLVNIFYEPTPRELAPSILASPPW